MKILDALKTYDRFNYFDVFFEQTQIHNQRTGRTRVFDGIYRLYFHTDGPPEPITTSRRLRGYDVPTCQLYDGTAPNHPPTILPIAVKEWVETEDGGDDEREIINFIGENGVRILGKSGEFDTAWFEKQPKKNPTTSEESLAKIVATAALYNHEKWIKQKLEELDEEHQNTINEQRTIDYLRYGAP